MSAVASFDVFDTVLTRLVGGPRQVFVETGRRLRRAHVIDVSPEVYASVREDVLARFTVDVRRHPPLRRVAAEVADRLGLDAACAETLYETELAVERDVLRAVPGLVEHVRAERRRTGRGVLFVSDTPLPTDFLQGLLEREGLFVDGDVLFTSADRGQSKQDGALYDHVRAEQGAAPADFKHTGDDNEADVVHARQHGWQASLRTNARFTAAERRLDAAAVSTDGLGPRLAGAGRLGRLRAVAEGAEPEISAIGADTALPLLVGFGLWVLSQARLHGLDRLYFVARDGEILREVTQALATARGDAVECRYLYGSRRVWQLAARGTARHQDAELWLPDELAGSERTAAEILELVGLTAAEAFALTADPVFAPRRTDALLGPAGFAAVRQALDGALRPRSWQRAQERRDLLLSYLDAEGVTAPGAVAIIDVGWTGRASRALEDVLEDAARPRPTAHLFIGLLDSAPAIMGPDLYALSHAWLVDEPAGRRLELDADEDLVMLVETFTTGSEGSTVGYREVDGVVSAQLAAPVNPTVGAWDFKGYRRAIGHALAAFTDGYVPGIDVDLRPLVVGQLLALWRDPSAGQARAWGAQLYGEDFYNARWHPLATPLTLRRVLTRLGVGPDTWREPTYWLAGTIAVSRQPWRTSAGLAYRYRRLPARLARVPRRLRGELLRRRG